MKIEKYVRSMVIGFLTSVITLAIAYGLFLLIDFLVSLNLKTFIITLFVVVTIFNSYMYFKKNY